MKLEMRGQMRMEQKMKLAPHMIQSMEILQLPILALQERIEQELNSNPVLETEPPESPEEVESASEDQAQEDTEEKDLVLSTDNNKTEDFERLDSLSDGFSDYMDEAGPFRTRIQTDEIDKKLEAMKNTAAPPQSLHDHLAEQWRLVEADEPVKKAGDMIIDYIDDRGYLSVRLEQLYNKDRGDFTVDDLKQALQLVQKLEPTGVGARDLKECQENELQYRFDQSGRRAPEQARHLAGTANRPGAKPPHHARCHCRIGRYGSVLGTFGRFGPAEPESQ
jgi:RNA polymerase sigma-54 factor